jgi:hypothetical protein
MNNKFNWVMLLRISNKENKTRILARKKFESFNVDISDNDIIVYGAGVGGGILSQNKGLLTADNQFIKYEDVISIKDKIDVNVDSIINFGLIGVALDNSTFKSIEIIFSGGKLNINNVRKTNAMSFIDTVKKRVNEATVKKRVNETKSAIEKTQNPLDQIEKAKTLLDKNIISEEEFQTIKKKFMERL